MKNAGRVFLNMAFNGITSVAKDEFTLQSKPSLCIMPNLEGRFSVLMLSFVSILCFYYIMTDVNNQVFSV